MKIIAIIAAAIILDAVIILLTVYLLDLKNRVAEVERLCTMTLRCFEECGLVVLNRSGEKITGFVIQGKVTFKQ